jgi:hypothetical protein
MNVSTLHFVSSPENRKSNHRSVWPLLAALLCWASLWLVRDRPVDVQPISGFRSATNSDVVLLIDDSGSAYDPDGTDPNGRRYDGARRLIEAFGQYSDGYSDSIAIVHFGTDAARTQLFSVAEQRGEIDTLLRMPKESLGGTQFIPPIREAKRLLEGVSVEPDMPRRRQSIVLFTDGLNEDDNQELRRLVQSLPTVDWFVVLFNGTSVDYDGFQQAKQFWSQTSDVELLHTLRGRRAERTFTRIARTQLGLSDP